MKLFKHSPNDYYLLDEIRDEVLASGTPEAVSEVLADKLVQGILANYGGDKELLPESVAREMAEKEIDLAFTIMKRENKTIAHFGSHSFMFPG